MDTLTVDALRTQIEDLARQVADLQAKAVKENHTPCLGMHHCHCRCRSPASSQNTCTGGGHGIYLGLVRAGDVAALPENSLKELDEGLKAIAQHLVPRGKGAPQRTAASGPFTRTAEEMTELLDKVSLRTDPIPVEYMAHFAAFRNPARGRYFRMGDARKGYMGLFPESHKSYAFYYETFLQLVLFRGIDLEALP